MIMLDFVALPLLEFSRPISLEPLFPDLADGTSRLLTAVLLNLTASDDVRFLELFRWLRVEVI